MEGKNKLFLVNIAVVRLVKNKLKFKKQDSTKFTMKQTTIHNLIIIKLHNKLLLYLANNKVLQLFTVNKKHLMDAHLKKIWLQVLQISIQNKNKLCLQINLAVKQRVILVVLLDKFKQMILLIEIIMCIEDIHKKVFQVKNLRAIIQEKNIFSLVKRKRQICILLLRKTRDMCRFSRFKL